MFNRIINGLVVVLMAAVLVLFELGHVKPGDALFLPPEQRVRIW